jgi:hypothetical protein
VDTYVIFTLNITASSTSLSSIGGRRSFVSIWQGARRQSARWRGMSLSALMTSPSFTFGGEPAFLPISIRLTLVFCSSSYANRSARFISAYHAGLSGSQAMWANKKYHSHRSLPPDIIAEVKCSVLA